MLNYEFIRSISYSDVYDKLEAIKLKCPALMEYFVNHQSLEHIYTYLTKRNPKARYRRLSFLQRMLKSYKGVL